MRSRPQRRRAWTLTAMAAASVALVAPADAPARRFTLPMPSAGDVSAGIVSAKVSVRPRGPLGSPRVQLRLVTPERRLPDNLIVAGRVQRVGRSNRYIARVFALRSNAGGTARHAAPAQDGAPPTLEFDYKVGPQAGRRPSVVKKYTIRFGGSRTADDMIEKPSVPQECFPPEPREGAGQWSGSGPLNGGARRMSKAKRRKASQFVASQLCGQPFDPSAPAELGVAQPGAVFAGIHIPFQGSPLEHVFQVHGNTNMGGFRIEPPPGGGAFVACTPACFLDGGGVVFIGPFPAGMDVEVNARANVPMPADLAAGAFEPGPGGVLDGPRHDFVFSEGKVKIY